MEVDESSSGSDEISKEQEDPTQMQKGVSSQTLQDLAAGRDCLLADEELLGNKKQLTAKFTPLSLVAQLKAKLPQLANVQIAETNVSESKD